MTLDNNKQVVAEFFARFSATDTAGTLELLDDAVIWRAMGRAKAANSMDRSSSCQPGSRGEILSQGELFQSVVIEGQTTLQLPDGGESKTLKPGSYISSQGAVTHQISFGVDNACIIYARNKSKYKVFPE